MCNLSCNPPPCLAFSPTGRSLSFLSRGVVQYRRSFLEFFVAEKVSVETEIEKIRYVICSVALNYPLCTLNRNHEFFGAVFFVIIKRLFYHHFPKNV